MTLIWSEQIFHVCFFFWFWYRLILQVTVLEPCFNTLSCWECVCFCMYFHLISILLVSLRGLFIFGCIIFIIIFIMEHYLRTLVFVCLFWFCGRNKFKARVGVKHKQKIYSLSNVVFGVKSQIVHLMLIVSENMNNYFGMPLKCMRILVPLNKQLNNRQNILPFF